MKIIHLSNACFLVLFSVQHYIAIHKLYFNNSIVAVSSVNNSAFKKSKINILIILLKLKKEEFLSNLIESKVF